MFVEMRETVLELLGLSWPMIVISAIIASTFRIVQLNQNEEKFIFHKEAMKLIFIIYILCLYQAVTYQDVSYAGANYIPFKEMFRYNVGSNLFFRNVIGNLLLFMPYGFFIALYTKAKKPIIIISLATVASLSIEITQLLIGRVFDVDDILLNIIGAIIGFLLYQLLKIINDKLPNFLKKDWILNIVTCLILGGALWFLMK